MVGEYTDAAGAAHAFTDDHGVFTRIDVPDATATRGRGINDRGDIVGVYVDRSGRTHGFVAQVSQ